MGWGSTLASAMRCAHGPTSGHRATRRRGAASYPATSPHHQLEARTMTTTRPPALRAALAAVLVALVVAGIGIAPVRAASAVAIDARVLLGGRYEAGGWAAVSVTLVNES